ncbi:MAG: glycoside hydrolase family 3 C-terminal domain-containing protein [Oscillospiraceae bacterium]|nr:glycoside hydrolase family 3 C-terminal domain-containing protein [Oscillospiraceae bacterium]
MAGGSEALLAAAAPVPVALAEALPGLADLSRQAAAEGMVLLENPVLAGVENATGRVLPIGGGQSVSVFGRAQANYYKSGTGSGGAVRVDHVTGILEALRTSPYVRVDEDLARVYADWVRTHPFDNGGGGWAAEPCSQAEMPLTDETVSAARAKSETAVVILGRTAGEDKDNTNTKGAYQLADLEVEMLNKVHAAFDRVVVVLNVGNVIDMAWVKNYPKAAVLYAWQGGMEGGSAVADVLTGDVTPSGKLSDTIAIDISDYPSHGTFEGKTKFGVTGSSLNARDFYAEDIYVGYRYFETFAPDRVLYPFGFGLSYTTFDIAVDAVTYTDDDVKVDVTVENTGAVKGKEVVQVYYSAPQGQLGKPARELAAFAKTGVLAPGGKQTLTISYRIADMASYDDGGYTGHESAYVLEAGDYGIYVGDSVRHATRAGTYVQSELRVTQQLQEALPPVEAFKRMKPQANEDGTYSVAAQDVPYTAQATAQANLNARIADNRPAALTQTAAKDHTLVDVYKGDVTVDEFVAQFTNTDLSAVVLGEGMNSTKVTLGTASAFGGVTNSLLSLGLPIACAADGPSGIRMEVGTQYATSIPNGTLLACTWNLELIERLSDLWGREMLLNKIDTILGPGVNIHRHPLNGRNFEYFSEDPLLTGTMAASMANGIQKHGPAPTIKHYAANNQEASRHYVHSVVSERALREIYLKGYEIAVKSGNVRSVMTSYNPINGLWTAGSYDLNTTILRNEWGFKGIVMTDWWAKMNESIYTAYSDTNTRAMVRAQNDLYMVVDNNTAGSCSRFNNNMSYIADGSLTIGELQRSAKNITEFLLKTPAFARTAGVPFEPVYTRGEDWFAVEDNLSPADPQVTEITVGGKRITTFNPLILDYKVYTNREISDGAYPTVAAVPGAGVTISVSQASGDRPASVITASAGGFERIYKVIFTDEEGLAPILENPSYAHLSGIFLNGEALEGFEPTKLRYSVGWESQTMPVVTAAAIDGAQILNIATDPASATVTIRCASTDQVNVYVVKFGAYPRSDEFDTTEMKPFWSVNTDTASSGETANWSLTAAPGALRITAERGDFWTTHNDLKNFFQQEAFGDWEATAKVTINKTPNANYNGLGIVAFQDVDNYVWLKYEYSSQRLVGFVKESGAAEPVSFGALTAAQITSLIGDNLTLYLRLKKIGDVYTGSLGTDGVNFTVLGSVAAAYAEPKFGLLCSHGSVSNTVGSFYADYDYVRFDREALPTAADVGADTKLKLAATEPALLTPNITPVDSGDTDGGRSYTNCSSGEALAYRLNILEGGTYKLSARIKSAASEVAQMSFSLYADDTYLGAFSTTSTGGRWVTLTQDVALTQGVHTLRLAFETSGIDVNWLRFQRRGGAVPDTEALHAAIAQAESIDLSEFPLSKRETFAPVLAEAKAVAADPVGQQEVDETTAALRAAIERLESGLPVNQPPKNSETFVNADGKRVLRIRAHEFPWIWAQSADFRYEGSSPNYNAGYISTGDTFYLGAVDLTGLEEIKVNYANGNTNSNQYQPSVNLQFYTEAAYDGEPVQRATHANSTYPYSDVYGGGSFVFGSQFAGINFLHKKSASWTVYGDASTAGNINAPGTHAGMTNYWEIGAKTFLNRALASGVQNVYMYLLEGGLNLRYVDLVYDTVTVSFDWNYEGAPDAPAPVTLMRGTALGAQLPAAAREDYQFIGWGMVGGSIVEADTPINDSVTLYAHWRADISLTVQMTGDDTALALATLRNRRETERTLVLILAAYNGEDQLVGVQTQTATAPAGIWTMLSIPLTTPPDTAYVKAFFWEDGAFPLLPDEKLLVP